MLGTWGWAGLKLSPGKGLMTHVWTNGSLWSYLLIQPHYFTSIKYVCPDLSLLHTPSPNASQQPANQKWGMSFPDFCAFPALLLGHSRHSAASIKEKPLTTISVNGSGLVRDPVEIATCYVVTSLSAICFKDKCICSRNLRYELKRLSKYLVLFVMVTITAMIKGI